MSHNPNVYGRLCGTHIDNALKTTGEKMMQSA